jgi:hypothetical protein
MWPLLRQNDKIHLPDDKRMFSFWKNPVKKCARSFLWYNVNRGKVTSWRILVSPPAAPSIFTQVPHHDVFLNSSTFSLVAEISIVPLYSDTSHSSSTMSIDRICGDRVLESDLQIGLCKQSKSRYQRTVLSLPPSYHVSNPMDVKDLSLSHPVSSTCHPNEVRGRRLPVISISTGRGGGGMVHSSQANTVIY